MNQAMLTPRMKARLLQQRGKGLRGGDSNTVDRGATSTTACRNANRQVSLRHWLEEIGGDALKPSRDPNDQAHGRYGPDGMLLPARDVDQRQKTPRRYPDCQLNGNGLPPDAVLDEIVQTQRWLGEHCGVALGYISQTCAEQLFSRPDRGESRDLTRRRPRPATRSEFDRECDKLEAEATRILNQRS